MAEEGSDMGNMSMPLNILLISAFYPPENEIAAARIASFAKYWSRTGAKVTVLTREPSSDGMEVPKGPNISVVRVRDPLAGLQASAHRFANEPSVHFVGRLVRTLLRFFKGLFRRMLWPDVSTIWAFRSIRELRGLERPDIIVASVGPLSTLRIAKRAAERFDCPLVIDYRDPMSTNPYKQSSRVRQLLDANLELSASSLASAIVTVSDPLVDSLGELTGRPAFLVRNGYEPSTFPQGFVRSSRDSLRLVHTGRLYEGRGDCAPLLDAVSSLTRGPGGMAIEVLFYGPPSPTLDRQICESGLQDIVKQVGLVPHAEVPEIQMDADVLLLVAWDNPEAKGYMHGKVFEYIAAGRPILMLGYSQSVAAKLISDLGVGICTMDANEVREFLEGRGSTLFEMGTSDASAAIRASLTREYQADRFFGILRDLVDERT